MSAMNDPMFPAPHLHINYGATLRAYAAIHLRVPDSGIPELDQMIEKARRQEMLGRALQGALSPDIWTTNECVAVATAAADAAIKAMEEKP